LGCDCGRATTTTVIYSTVHSV